MFIFSVEGVFVIIGIISLSALIFYLLLRRMNARIVLNKTEKFKKIAVIIIPIGLALIIFSGTLYFKTMSDIEKSISILRPLAEGLSEPIFIFVIFIFIIGLMTSILGCYYFKNAKKSE